MHWRGVLKKRRINNASEKDKWQPMGYEDNVFKKLSGADFRLRCFAFKVIAT